MPGRRKEDVDLLIRLATVEDEIEDLDKELRKAQAFALGARDDLTREFKELQREVRADLKEMRGSISAHAIKTLSEDKTDRKEIRLGRWHFIGVVLGILVYGAVMPSVLNWERVQVMWSSISAHFQRAGNTKVPLMLDVTKKPRRRRPKPKPLPPIVMPEAKNEAEEKVSE